MIRKLIMALAATGIVLGASACNTVKGLGNDIESVGNAGDRAMKK
jgi:entericidin B